MKKNTLQEIVRRSGHTLFLLVMIALLAPARVWGQETLTVHNGTTQNNYVPIYGVWCDAYLKCEMVYPATELNDMAGGEINQIVYYTTNIPNAWNGSFQVFLKEVDFTSISSYQGNSGATVVYQGTLDVTLDKQVVVNFSEPFIYQGGNLLIGVYRTVKDAYSSCNFYGENVSGASVQGYNSSSLNSVTATQRNFLPKTTFTYELGNPKPQGLTASNITSHGATLSWTAPNEDVIGYAYQYQPAGGEWTTLENTTETSVTLTGLLSDTDYSFQVKALYADNVESNFATTNFHTQVSCPRPVDLQATLTQGNATVATLSWTESGEAATWILEYSENANFTDAFVMTVNTTPSCSLINLTPETKYYARVKADCGDGDQSQWSNTLTFRPTNCSVVTIGEGTNTTSIYPISMANSYSLTQQIYTAEEIGMEGSIYSISFYYNSTNPFSVENVKVLMKHVNRGVFNSALDKEPLTIDDLVWTGTFSATETGWVTIDFDTPFVYDGSSNLLVCVCDNTSGAVGSGYNFLQTTYNASEYRSMYWYTNTSSYNPDPYSNSTSFNGNSGRNFARNNTQFYILPVAYPRPVDLQATLTEGDATTATLSWTEKGTATSWVVEYGTAADFTGASSVTVNGTPSCSLTGLTAEARYYARVKAVSGDSQSQWSKTVDFRPSNCLNIVIGNEATTNYSYYYPVTMPYNYSLTEQIYTADEIGVEGMIYSISFYYYSSYSFSMSDLKVYMKNLARSVFVPNNNDKVSLYDTDLVWTGTLSASEPGWVTIDLDTPFAYDGLSNLLVAVYDNQAGCFTENQRFLTTSCTEARCLYWYSNDYIPSLTSTTYSGSRYYPAYRNNILIDILPPSCLKPVDLRATLSETDATVASLSWTENGSANDWVLQYGTDKNFADNTYTEVTTGFVRVGDTITANLTNLTPEQRLYARVKANCGSGDESLWSKVLEFRPTVCEVVPILGNSTNSNYAYPVYMTYNYSMSQQIYTAEEIGYEGTIYSISYYYGTKPLLMNGVKIYMKNVTRSVFANSTDKEPLTDANLVWTGTMTAPGTGWITINLDTPFAYDGVSNLLVTVWDPTSGKFDSNYSFRMGSCTGNKSIVWYSDSNSYIPNPTDNSGYYGDGKGMTQSRNHIQLGIVPVSCPRPDNLQATLDPTNATIATLSWTEKGEATNWVLEYGTAADFTGATTVNVSNASIDLTGLTAEAKYYARVKADYGSAQSEWSNTLEFRPTTCTNVAIGTETNTLYCLPIDMSSSCSRTQQIYTAEEIGMEGLIYDISFYYSSYTSFSLDNIVLSMKNVTRSGFTSSSSIEPTTAEDIVWTGTLKADRDGWLSITLDTPFAYDGVSNLLVEFYDGNDSDGYLNSNYAFRTFTSTINSVCWFSNTPSYVPQYSVTPNGCSNNLYSWRNNIQLSIMPDTHPRPIDVEASLSAFTPASATISWTERGEATSWTLQYSTDSEFATYEEVTSGFTVDGNIVTANLTGLTPETTYYARVKADYDGGIGSGWSLTYVFVPTAYITIGNGTSATSSHPVSTYYNYSFTQQIYTADEIIAAYGGAGTITSVAFNYRGYAGASNTMEGIQVYMINTSKSVFDGYSDVVALSEADKVYEGPLEMPAEGGWTTLVLDNEFDYDGTNILICVIDPTEGYPTGGSSCAFYTTSTTYTSSLCRYENNTVFDVATLTDYTANYTSSHNQIRFQPTLFPKPRHLTVDNITPHTADLAWEAHDSSVTGYEYQYKLGEGEWTALASTTNTSLTLTELTPEGEYTFRVRALYAGGASEFVSLDFTVLATCPVPTDLQYALTLGDGTVATLTWQQGYFEEAWVLQYGTDSEFTDGSYTEVTTGFTVEGSTISASLTGLTPEVTYYARVKADCGGGDQSYWIQTEFIPTDVIPLTAVNGTDNSGYVPLYCQYAQYGTSSQFIIPRTRLFEAVDGVIHALTFYSRTTTATNFNNASYKVYVAEVDFTTFTTVEPYNWTDMTQVYEGLLYCDGQQMTITFDTPYYYTGGNLMIGFSEYEAASMSSYYWYAEYLDVNVSYYSYGASNLYLGGYLPNTTVHYVSRGITDTPRPKYLTANCVLARTATMKWAKPADNVTGYQWQYKADGDEEWTIGSTTDTVVNLTDLTVVTPYTFQVKALYPDEGESEYATVTFNTHNLCDYPSDLTATLTPYNGSMATISWTENGEATSWVLQCSTSSSFPEESTVEITEGFEVVDGNHVSCTLTGLTEANYYVRVRPACGEEELWTTMSSYFHPTYASFSFNEVNYTNYFCYQVPIYGNNTHCGTMSQFIIPSAMLSDLAGGTIQRMRFRSYSGYSISNSTFGDAEFEVYMKEVDNTSFASYYLSDWTDWENLDEVYHGTLSIISKQMWIDFDEGFTYKGDNLLIGFKQTTAGSTNASVYWVGKGNGDNHSSVYAYKTSASATTYSNAGFGFNQGDSGPFLPEIIFRYIPTGYPGMENVVTMAVTDNTAQFSWVAPNENVTGYAYQYKRLNEEWPEEWTTTNNTEVTLENLRQVTHYRFRVKVLYGENESVPYYINFMTECGVYADVPFTENFDSYFSDAGEVPYCWSFITSNGYPKITSDYSRSGRNKLYFYSYSSYSDEYAILPQVQNVNEYRIKFYARVNSTSYPSDIVVGVMTDPTDVNSFTPIETVDILSDSYQKFKVSFENYTGGDGFIALKMATPSSSQYKYVYMDDVTVEPIPSCDEPEFEEILNVTNHTASLRWTDDGAGTWQVYASTENVMPADTVVGQVVTTNPGTITELEAETPYYVWVRSLCGDGTYSHWSDAYAFTTEVACPIPADFEVTNVTGHTATLTWTDLYGGPTQWQICLNDDTNHLITADSNPFTVTGLDANSSYSVKVRANCGTDDGFSEWSSYCYIETPISCYPVDSLEVTSLGSTSATLAWVTNQQQEVGNAPSVWNVEYAVAPATTYDFESPIGIPEYYTDNQTDWTIVSADTIASLTAHSGTHCLISNNDEDDTYIYIPAYGGAAASFWAKSLVENDTVFITIYYDGYNNSGGGDEPYKGGKGRNARKGWNSRENRDEYMGSYYVTSETYKKITVDLADYIGDGSLTIRVSGQVALDDVTVNTPATTVTQQTLNFNQGSIGNYAQYWDGWSLVTDGDDGYIMSEANYEEAYVDFHIQLGYQISFRAKALVDENDTIKYYLYVWNNNVGLIARDSIMVTDTFEEYSMDLSDYSGMAYLEFYLDYQPSLVIDDLSVPSVSMYTTLTVNGEPTLQMTNLQQLAVYEVYVQAHCGEEDESSWEWTSFVPALCESENQCQITYEWNTATSNSGWNDAYLKVIHHESGLRVGLAEMDLGTSGSGTFSLCDGETYDLYYYLSGKNYVDFTVYDPAGNVIASYDQFQSLPENGPEYITFTMDCSVCQWPQNLKATNITTESALLTWEQDGDVTSWLVSYRETESDSLVLALNESNWTALPQDWTPLTIDNNYNLVALEDWTPLDGALVSDTLSFLFIPVNLGGQAVITAHGNENEAIGYGAIQRDSLVGLSLESIVDMIIGEHALAESAQTDTIDLSDYQGNGYLFLVHECEGTVNLYLDSLVVYEPFEAEWSEGVIVNTTPSYTLTGLTAGTSYQAKVQPVCGVNEYGNPKMVSFATPFCNPASQCEIYYELHDTYGDGWNNAYIAIVNGSTEVARLTIESGNLLSGALPLCPGSYQFVWHVGNYDNECYFTIYDPDENVIVYKNSGTYPETGNMLDEPYEHFCRLEVMFTEGWNWWAPTVATNVLELEDLDELDSILSQNGPLSGDLDLVAGQMYKVLVSDDCILSLDGEPFTTATVSIAQGYNWFGFIGNTEMSVTAVFEDFGPVAGDKVISQDGGFAIYTVVDEVGSWQGTLTTLVPGKGYVYVSKDTNPEGKTLIIGQ